MGAGVRGTHRPDELPHPAQEGYQQRHRPKLNEVNEQLTQLQAERRRLLKNDDLEEVMDALQQTADIVKRGPEHLMEFDEGLFLSLVERIVVESQTCIRFRLKGGIELTERLKETRR